MKKITLLLSFCFLLVAENIFAQACNNLLTVTVSNVVNSSSCTTPCSGSATASATGALGYSWTPANQATATATGLCAGTYTVTAIDASFNCGTATVTITCTNGVVDLITPASLNIFPNPAINFISVDLISKMQGNFSLNVLNVLGEVIYHETVAVNGNLSKRIDVVSLPQGVYFLELKNEKITLTEKFFKE